MIRKTINGTKASTFIVLIPDKNKNDFPKPNGTGFFISSEGYFITANHVIKDVDDFAKLRFSQPKGVHILNITLIKKWKNYDIALLKADFDENRKLREKFLENKDGFPYLKIDFEDQIEGTPVYAYGFPLSEVGKTLIKGVKLGGGYHPRVTSAIISSKYDTIKPIRGSNDPIFYATDKYLIYGNSGGPIILTKTGKVFALAVRFQPVFIPQPLIKDPSGNKIHVFMPSNYGIISSLKNIEDFLKDKLDI